MIKTSFIQKYLIESNGLVNNMINKKMITVKLNKSRFSAYDNLELELQKLKRELLNQLKDKKVGRNNDI